MLLTHLGFFISQSSIIPFFLTDNNIEICKTRRFFINESNRNSTPNRRPRQGSHTKGDTPHNAYPRRRPVTDDIDTVGEILLRHAGAGETAGLGVGYIAVESEDKKSWTRERGVSQKLDK